MTGTEWPASLRRCLKSIPDLPLFRLMSRRTQRASSKSMWFSTTPAGAAVALSLGASQGRHRRQEHVSDLARSTDPRPGPPTQPRRSAQFAFGQIDVVSKCGIDPNQRSGGRAWDRLMVDRTRDAGTIADVQRRFPSRKFLPLGSLD